MPSLDANPKNGDDPAMAEITSVIFDWGGVLIDDPAPGLLSIMGRTLGVSAEAFVAALKRHAEPFQKGTCSESEFWRAMCADLGVALPGAPSLWGSTFREIYRTKPAVWELARSLRAAGYKTAMLSNTEMPGVEFLLHGRESGPSAEPRIPKGPARQEPRPPGSPGDFFDALVFSCCEGCRKPERRIYELALERLKSKPQEAVFIDDREDYAAGARAVGLRTILFTNPKALVRELEGMGVCV